MHIKVKTIDERVAELLAAAPPITPGQREAAIRLLVNPPKPARERRSAA